MEDDESRKSMIRRYIKLPIRMFAKLEEHGLDAEGNMLITLSKRNKNYMNKLAMELEFLTGEDISIVIDLGGKHEGERTDTEYVKRFSRRYN